MSPDWHVAQPYCIALAPQCNSPEPIWYIGCKVVGGQDKILYSQQFFDQNYPELSRWTKSIPDAPRVCRVTFGGAPYSYFACAVGHGSTWAGVSSELTDKVQKAFDTPSCVALGVGDSWFVVWPDGYFAWKFYGAYPELDKILTDANPRTVSYLAISPYNPHHYFLAFRDGTVKYNFAGVPEWIAPMQEVFAQWHTQILQRQQPQPPFTQLPRGAALPLPPNNYTTSPPAAAPVPYIAAHYANAHSPPPGMPQYNPYGPQTPAVAPVELAGNTLLPAPQQQAPVVQRSVSTEKKKSFLSKAFGKA